MSRLQTFQHSSEDVQGAGHRDAPAERQFPPQGPTRHVLHHQVDGVGATSPVVHGDDVRVREAGGRPCLRDEAVGEPGFVEQVVVHHLDGDDPFETIVEALIDRAHPAGRHNPVHAITRVEHAAAEIRTCAHEKKCTFAPGVALRIGRT